VSETNAGDGDAAIEPPGDGAVASGGDAAAEPTIRKARVPGASKATETGRATPKGGATVRQPAASGRYTPPIPRQQRHSPRWFPFVLLGFLVLGLLLIVLNYVNVLPGGTNNWYLIGGIVAIVVGLFMATFYH
jgi:hypothetical protein